MHLCASRLVWVWLSCITLLASCGSDTNVNYALFATQGQTQSMRSKLMEARYNYDQGFFDRAQGLAEEVVVLSPDNEEAAIILGYIYLAQAGLDPFTLIKKMIAKTEQKTALALASTDAVGALTDLQDLINLKNSDFELMADLHTSENKFFKGLDVYMPKVPGTLAEADSPRRLVPTLQYMNKTIQLLCPFVHPDLFVTTSDARYQEALCPKASPLQSQSTQSSIQTAHTHFLFAIAHLIESLVFNSVLLYQSTPSTTSDSSGVVSSNLLRRVEALNQSSFSQDEIVAYLEAVSEIKKNVEGIFDTSDTSMLHATLIDLRMVVSSFKHIPSIPVSVTSQISNGLTSLEQAAEKAGKAKDDVDSQSSALKRQMNEQIVTKLNTSMEQFIKTQNLDAASLSPEDQEKLEKVCSSFASIAGAGVALPTGCP